ncbi:MAG: oxidase [Bacteroidetes bacterium]|nr:MAG: oxidase [Bacteroidota bacterium]
MSQAEHHIVPIKTLTAVIAVLGVLTIVTVAAAQFDLGSFNVPIALLIATIKASFVISIFMGLKYGNKTNALILAVGLIMVVVFVTFILLDTEFRGDTSATESGTIMQSEQTMPAAESH